VSANDNNVFLVNGVSTVVQNPPPDTIAIIDLKQFPPKVLAEIEVPVSVAGPPLSVAITPDESLALVTAAMKINPGDPTKQIPDNRLSVIDLKASSPKVIATLETGKGPAGLSINHQGNRGLRKAKMLGKKLETDALSGRTRKLSGRRWFPAGHDRDSWRSLP